MQRKLNEYHVNCRESVVRIRLTTFSDKTSNIHVEELEEKALLSWCCNYPSTYENKC